MLAMQESIQKDVVNKLATDRCGNSTDIEVSVVGSNVILSGTVPSHVAHRTIIRGVWCVPSVSAIVDKLTLGMAGVTDRGPVEQEEPAGQLTHFESHAPDPSIPSQVMRSLEQSDCLELDPCAVEVVVENGTVTLEGMVPSRAAVQAALDAARRTPGVAKLRNRLILAP